MIIYCVLIVKHVYILYNRKYFYGKSFINLNFYNHITLYVMISHLVKIAFHQKTIVIKLNDKS